MRVGLGTMFGSLRIRNFRLFATGQLVKLIGVWAQFIAQDWLVLQLTDNSATALGFVTALQFLPVLLLTLYGGRLADRYDKRTLLISVNAAFAAAAIVLGALVTTGSVALWHVFGFAAVIGIISSIETPVRQSFVAELVPLPLLPNALALSAATFNTARIVGPAIAGLAIGWFGVGPVFLADAVLCTAVLVALVRMRSAELLRADHADATKRDARIVDGLRYVWRRPDLLVPIVLVLIVGMFGFNFQLTLAVMSKTVFHTGASTFGLLTTALAAGALAGAMASTGRRARPPVTLVLAAAAAFGTLEISVGFAPTLLVAALLLVPTGFFMIYFAQAANQRVQLGTDAAYRGRVMALYVLVFLGTSPIGAPLVGWCAENIGPRSGLWIGGLLSLLAALVMAALQVRRERAGQQAVCVGVGQ
ncbi:MAG: MFS transporter [Dactylosporangium sp.]|nr:MFS transporter [Dactylosporangium sp.]NNJ59539.1 MFS transporter [Dactylosporangium sp.]